MLKGLREKSISKQPVVHQPGKSILDITNLTFNFNSNTALENITFNLQTGERIAVVGPNGAGKSTLFKIIAGILKPTLGDVRISGHKPGVHICIAYLPQRTHVDWSFPVSVADVVMMGRVGKIGFMRLPQRKDWDLVHQSLFEVGLENLANRQIGELSGGQQQRMFIARALAQQAELMLMDEPLTGLDLSSQESIFDILEDLRKRSVTVLIATHDLDLAAGRFDRVMLLNRRILGFGLPQVVFTPEHLLSAYGGHLHLVQTDNQLVVVADTCCDDSNNN